MLTAQQSYNVLRNVTRGIAMKHDDHDAVEQCLNYLFTKAQEAEEGMESDGGTDKQPQPA